MADGTRLKSLESQIQQIQKDNQQAMAEVHRQINEQRQLIDQRIEASEKRIEDQLNPLKHNANQILEMLLENRAKDQGHTPNSLNLEINSIPNQANPASNSPNLDANQAIPNQESEYKALPESFTAVANLALGDSGVKVIDGREAKDVLIEEISESGIVKEDELEIASDEDTTKPYSDGEFPNLSVGLLPSSLELLIASCNVSKQVVVEVELLIDGTFISKNSNEMMTNSFAYNLFDEMPMENLLALRMNRNWHLAVFDPGGRHVEKVSVQRNCNIISWDEMACVSTEVGERQILEESKGPNP